MRLIGSSIIEKGPFSETARNKCSRKLGGLESTRLAIRSFLLHIRRCPHLGRGPLMRILETEGL